ncbi:MAG: hypothetical protein R2854_29885 [Caldilineaceae bacterium]
MGHIEIGQAPISRDNVVIHVLARHDTQIGANVTIDHGVNWKAAPSATARCWA